MLMIADGDCYAYAYAGTDTGETDGDADAGARVGVEGLCVGGCGVGGSDDDVNESRLWRVSPAVAMMTRVYVLQWWLSPSEARACGVSPPAGDK